MTSIHITVDIYVAESEFSPSNIDNVFKLIMDQMGKNAEIGHKYRLTHPMHESFVTYFSIQREAV